LHGKLQNSLHGVTLSVYIIYRSGECWFSLFELTMFKMQITTLVLLPITCAHCHIWWAYFYCVAACNAMHGIATRKPFVSLSVKRMDCDKTN